jgi:hypothetical protein
MERVYHGTDEHSARSISEGGLDPKAWEQAAGGAGPDFKGFSVTDNFKDAEDWAKWRAWERLGPEGKGVVLEADPAQLPLRPGLAGEWVDPGERFIRPEDFPAVGPGVFQPVQSGG